ncbi:GNAT family N-acetyltransferase [Rhodobacterales bacterium HKCCE2091]|nr:GNAT family N-acetyltransferase [Rhodobacterales bacterium HKCCE2091]
MKIGPALSATSRERCFAIRRAVFIEEQAIPEAEEWDELDAVATHFLAWDDAGPAGTARLVARDGTAKIGRVAVMPGHRGTGLGLKLMRTVLRHAKEQGLTAAALDAQTYAVPFYEKLGFRPEGEEFDDGSGILHRRMCRNLQAEKSPA